MSMKTFRFRREWYDYIEVEAATREIAYDLAADSPARWDDMNFDGLDLIEEIEL